MFMIFLPKMTLEDEEEVKPTIALMNKMGIGEALQEVMIAAQSQERLTCGVYESAQHLEENAENVMLCILPELSPEDDVTLNIHFTLIEAFCWENEIHVVKVDSVNKLIKLFSTTPTSTTSSGSSLAASAEVNGNDITSDRTYNNNDFHCILVQYPHETATSAEEDIMEFCKSTSDLMPYPVVELPV